MVGLEQSLAEHELIVLRTLGEWWELSLDGMDQAACAATLAERLQQIDMDEEMLYLQVEEAEGFRVLIEAGGRIPVSVYERTYGDVRPMGPAALEREEPWLDPHSVAEALWYRGFVFKGFDETDSGLMEFYYVPPELLALFPEHEGVEERVQPKVEEVDDEPPDNIVSVAEEVIEEQTYAQHIVTDAPSEFTAAATDAVDIVTTLLVWAQNDVEVERDEKDEFLRTIATDVGLVKNNRPTRQALTWLKESRAVAHAQLTEGWTQTYWNALFHVPTLICEEGQWQNDPAAPRTTLLGYLPRTAEWVSIDALIALIKENAPDFQRPDGNYDTWYIRDGETNDYLSGFECWDAVEGRLLRYMMTEPMQWLGLVDVADDAVRPTPALLTYLNGEQPTAADTPLPIIIQPTAKIVVPIEANRFHRFQLSRIAELEPPKPDTPWVYQITPDSLATAKEQGIQGERVLQFLEEVGDGRPLPASTKRAIERWSKNGIEGKLLEATILHVSDKAIIEKLRKNEKTRPYIGESLGELAVAITCTPDQFRNITAQLGLLLDSP